MMTSAQRELSRFTAIFAGGTMISRVVGLVRDSIILALTPKLSRDAFLLAFRFPNMLRDLVGEGALNAAFVPLFSETLEKDSKKGYQELVAAAMSAMVLLLVCLTIVGILVMPALLHMNHLESLTGGERHSAEYLRMTVSLGRWTFPYILFIGLTVFAMGALFTVKHYSTPSWSPVLLNIALIACCLLFYWNRTFRALFPDPAYALVLGVWLGGIAQLVVQYRALAKYAGVWRPSFNLRHPGLGTLFTLLAPLTVGQAAGEVNKFVDALFAYSLGKGSVTALYAANRLVQLPLSIFGIATSVAILPAAARAAAYGKDDEVRATLQHGFRQSCFLILPSMLGLMVLGKPIVQLLFEFRGGEFDASDTSRTATALAFYAAGLLSFAWIKVAVTGFYAVQNTKTPVAVASASMILNILLNCAMVRPCGYWGLALATSISYTVNFILLYVLLWNRFGPLWDGPFLTALLRITVASAMMAAVARAVYLRLIHVLPGNTFTSEAVSVFCTLLVAVLAYLALCWALDIPDLRQFLAALRRKRPAG
jgi:putative peptidoglycan lipid II flippase